MIRPALLSCITLVAASACVSPERPVRAGAASLPGAEPGALLSAASGETLYTERAGTYSWALSFDETASIAGYTIEAGLYPLSAVSPDGYVFALGDGCVGEPTVSAGRFSDAAAALFLPLDGGNVCVNTVFDYRRCAPVAAQMIPALEEDAAPHEHALIFEGLDERAADPIARFTLETRTGDRTSRETLSAPVSGLLTTGLGAFHVVDASREAATVRLLDPIGGAPLALPQFIEPEPADSQESWAEAVERYAAQDAADQALETAPSQSENRSDSPALPGG